MFVCPELLSPPSATIHQYVGLGWLLGRRVSAFLSKYRVELVKEVVG